MTNHLLDIISKNLHDVFLEEMIILSANRQYRLSQRPHSHIARDGFLQLLFSDRRLLFAKAVTLLFEK